jgi:hypothetical protein
MLKSLDECADRIEAAGLHLRPAAFDRVASALRNGNIDILTLSTLRREAERLVEGLKSIDRIVAVEQGRVPR